MRKEYGKPVREHFFSELKGKYSSITMLKEKSMYIFPGETVFVVPTTSSAIAGFILLVPDHQGRDQFTVEIGWSTKGRFPESRRRPSGTASASRSEFREEEFICRLCDLWGADDFWWGQNRTAPTNWKDHAVSDTSDAVDRLARFGMPYLDEFFAVREVARTKGGQS